MTGETTMGNESQTIAVVQAYRLISYEAIKQALSEARSIYEVKEIRDKAEAIRLYARQAKDTKLEAEAIEIRLRAERKAGQMLIQMRDAGLLAKHGDNRHNLEVPDRNLLTLSDIDITKKQSAEWGDLADLLEDEFKARLEKVREAKVGLSATSVIRMANISANSEHGQSDGIEIESDRWHTPSPIIELARQLMGEIDLDPASNASAQETVKASRFYTRDNDGLAQRWKGHVWLNPPYSQPLISQFVDKLIQEYALRVSEAVVLVNNATDTEWFQKLAAAGAVMFSRSRIQYSRPGDEQTGSPRQGQALFYLGQKTATFRSLFSDLFYSVNL